MAGGDLFDTALGLPELAGGDRHPHLLERIRAARRPLQQLRRAGLVSTRREGKRVVYRLADAAETDIVSLLGALRRVAEHAVASMERIVVAYFRARDELEPVAARELLARLRKGDVMILDVRPEDEYGLGHLPGALNIPLGQLEERFSELPRKQEIVAYCRDSYCVLSFEAVAELRAPVQKKEVIQRRRQGATLRELARSYNVGISTIRCATRAA